ncbi:MAG: hypothetical protein NVSMB48_05590 [Marmoricola sp.]
MSASLCQVEPMVSCESVAALVAKRRKDAIDMRVAGVDLLTIARQLAADPAVNAKGVPYPRGYGASRYAKGQSAPSLGSLKAMVVNDIVRSLAERQSELTKSVDRLVEVHHERLERLWYAAFKAVSSGDIGAIDRAVRILERQSKLHGLDAPSRSQVSLDVDMGDDELNAEIERVLSDLADIRVAELKTHKD